MAIERPVPLDPLVQRMAELANSRGYRVVRTCIKAPHAAPSCPIHRRESRAFLVGVGRRSHPGNHLSRTKIPPQPQISKTGLVYGEGNTPVEDCQIHDFFFLARYAGHTEPHETYFRPHSPRRAKFSNSQILNLATCKIIIFSICNYDRCQGGAPRS